MGGAKLKIPKSFPAGGLSTWERKCTSRGTQYNVLKRPRALATQKTPAKRIRTSQATLSAANVAINPMYGFFEEYGPPQEPLKMRNFTNQNDYLRAFDDVSDIYLAQILRSEGPEVLVCKNCKQEGEWQCLGCIGRPVFCTKCCRLAHESFDPFHRVRRWNGSFFEPDWLMNTGLVVYIGHGGARCPNAQQEETNRANDSVSMSEARKLSTESLSSSGSDSDDLCREFPKPSLDNTSIQNSRCSPDIDNSDSDSINSDTGTEDNDETHKKAEQGNQNSSEPDGNSFFDFYGEIWRHTRRSGNSILHVVHDNGVHPLPFQFCSCATDEKDLQLLDSGFFPASFNRIRTVFTFECLDDYLANNLECKTAARAHWAKLAYFTNAAFPMTVPERYRELRRVAREWRKLSSLKRQGFGHRHEEPGPGDLAIFCPICPQPGVNLPDDWEEDADQDLYMRQYAIDGNFSAVHQRQKNPEDDVWLSNGNAFMVERQAYQEHLLVAKTYPIPRDCNKLHAAIDNVERVGCDVTGIGALCCLRNGFFVPHSVVDFQKGEQQKNIDYAVSQVLNGRHMSGIRKVLLVYDIMCQWQAKFNTRFEKEPFLSIPEGLEIRKAIGDMHVRGHVRECFPRYTLGYVKGAGVIDGEILETNWAVTNEITGTTRGASLAARAEVLDDHMNYSNFKKLIQIVPTLVRKLKRAYTLVEETVDAFEKINKDANSALVGEWDQKSKEAQEKRASNPKAMDYFAVKTVEAPSQASKRLTLTKQEENSGKCGMVALLCDGIEIQESQLSLRTAIRAAGRFPTVTEETSILERRGKLRECIRRYQQKAAWFLQVKPDDLPEEYEDIHDDELPDGGWSEEDLPIACDKEVENFCIALPSSLPSDNANSALRIARKQELELRVGQCNDALQAVRSEIARKSFVFTTNVRKAKTKRYKLKAWDQIHSADYALRQAVAKYRTGRRALMALGPSDAEKKRFQVLKTEDLQAKSIFLDSHVRGVKHNHLPWFWTLDVGSDSIGDVFLCEVLRVNWLRAQEACDRALEEKKRVEHEMKWGVAYFRYKSKQWRDWEDLSESCGHRYYARRQSRMWSSMASRAEHEFHKALNS